MNRPFNNDDAGTGDTPADAAPLTPTPSHEFVGGAGRLTGATYTFEVEIGHPVSQQPATGPTFRIEGNTAVKPRAKENRR